MRNLAEVLSKWRFISRLTVRDAAARIGLDAATYSRLERGIEVSASTLRTALFWLLKSEEAATAAQEVSMGRSGQNPDADDGEATTRKRGSDQPA